MKLKLLSTVIISICLQSQAFGEGKWAARDAVYDFIKANLIGRSLTVRNTGKISNNAIEADFERTSTFRNLERTAKGLTFQCDFVIKQTNWDLDQNGKRTGTSKNVDRTLTETIEVAQSESSGAVIGFSRFTSNSLVDPTGSHRSVIMSLKGDALEVRYIQALYDDAFDKKNNRYPGRSPRTLTFTVVDGKLQAHDYTQVFLVNPETLENEKKTSEYEAVDKEI